MKPNKHISNIQFGKFDCTFQLTKTNCFCSEILLPLTGGYIGYCSELYAKSLYQGMDLKLPQKQNLKSVFLQFCICICVCVNTKIQSLFV